MNRIGLALSGGGFRATLYHLGLTRFLRDAGILSQVTHVTSVSGGSIFAAHLALNWDRYNGSPSEFDAAASELLSIVRLDVRNRITRRFPLVALLRWPLRLVGASNRRLTRTGLLEYHYERHLYGDTSLFELPEKPQFHILATNLSEGALSSFTRNGLMIVRRTAENTFRIDHTRVGLATVPMAVAASSAFPGFFPPLELTGADVGASVGEFGRQAYTDGGVFDNLGMRMFRFLERSILGDSALSPDDFYDLSSVWQALHEAGTSSEETPLRRLAQVLVEAARSSEETPLNRLAHVLAEPSREPGSNVPSDVGTSSNVARLGSTDSESDRQKRVLSSLSDVMRHYQFFHERVFARLKPADPAAEELLRAIHVEGRIPNATDQLWLNRHLLEAAFRDTTGHPCFRRLNSGLDGVIVSDVGKPIEVKSGQRAGGLIRTALRSSDILMDRVWQLEQETFRNTPGFVFVPITEVVEANEDPTAMHPEVQRQMANIRTDLDRFSPLEISSLVRHGYCVGRKACRARPDLFGGDLPIDAPWDPITPSSRWAARAVSAPTPQGGRTRAPAEATIEARTLQASALRRIWSSLFDPRDWTSYVYLPILVVFLILLPTKAYRYYQSGQQNEELIEWLYQGAPDLAEVKKMLELPTKAWSMGSGVSPEEVGSFDQMADNTDFEVVKETRIIDLRFWNPADSFKSSLVETIREISGYKASDGNSLLSLQLLPIDSTSTVVRFPPQRLRPKLFKTPSRPAGFLPDLSVCQWVVTYDFSLVPKGQIIDLKTTAQSPGLFLGTDTATGRLSFHISTDTAQLAIWILMPYAKNYDSWLLTRSRTSPGEEKPGRVDAVRPTQEFVSSDHTIIGFQLVSLKAGETYDVSWAYAHD